MNKFIVASVFIFLGLINSSGAAPATNVQVSYNADVGVLDILADHPTDRMDRYFIRRVVVTKNSDDIKSFYFSRQRKPDRFVESIDYQAEPGDSLAIDLYSSEGGASQAILEIPLPEEPKG